MTSFCGSHKTVKFTETELGASNWAWGMWRHRGPGPQSFTYRRQHSRDPVCSKAALDSSIAPCIEIYQQRRSEASLPSLPGPQGNYVVIDPFLSFARMIIKQLMSVSNHIVSCFKFIQ